MKSMIAVVAAAIVAGMTMNGWAGEPAAGDKPAPMTAEEKARLAQQKEQEASQKQLEMLNKEIGETETRLAKLKQENADDKGTEKKVYRDKLIANLEEGQAQLQEIKKAMEGGDMAKARTLREKYGELKSAWNISGEKSAQFESEKALWNKRMGAEAPMEVQTAWNAYSQATEALFAKSKEVRELELKRMEARKQLEKSWQESQKKARAEAEKAKVKQPKPEEPKTEIQK